MLWCQLVLFQKFKTLPWQEWIGFDDPCGLPPSSGRHTLRLSLHHLVHSARCPDLHLRSCPFSLSFSVQASVGKYECVCFPLNFPFSYWPIIIWAFLVGNLLLCLSFTFYMKSMIECRFPALTENMTLLSICASSNSLRPLGFHIWT